MLAYQLRGGDGNPKHSRTLLNIVLAVFLAVCSLVTCATVHHNAADSKRKAAIEQSYVIVDSLGGTYYGAMTKSDYTGKGEFQHLGGAGTYEGTFDHSKRDGEGTFTWENGDVYQGEWQKDQMTKGTYTFADGRSFKGEFSNNAFYSGSFTGGSMIEGVSLLTATLSKGEVKKLDVTFTDGAKYSGSLNGEAAILYQSGNTYLGGVKKGMRSGEGVFTWKDGESTLAYYSGSWDNDLMSGTGAYHYSESSYPYIEGTFKDGHLDGTAVYYKEYDNAFTTTWSDGICTSVTEI